MNNKPSESLVLWIRQQIKESAPGVALPSVRSLAEEWKLHERTVRRLTAPFVKKGVLCTIQGKGTFVGRPPGPAAGANPKPSLSAAENLVDNLVQSIARGDLKRGDCLPQVKFMSLRFHVAPMTVIRAYGRLREIGYVTRIGKRFFIGRFSELAYSKPGQIVVVYHDSGDFTSLFHNSNMSPALREMEEELTQLNIRMIYKLHEALGADCHSWAKRRSGPVGIMIANMNEEKYRESLPALKELLGLKPKPGILLVGGGPSRPHRDMIEVAHGSIFTNTARVISRFCLQKGFSNIHVFIDRGRPALSNEKTMTEFSHFSQILSEIRHEQPNSSVRIEILESENYGTVEEMFRFIRNRFHEDHIKYLANINSKYRRFTIEELAENMRVSGKFESVFRKCRIPCLWIFTSDHTAAQALSWLRENRRPVPEEVAVLGLENDPKYYHLGITACVPDWRGIGYLMAHSLLKDIPIERTSRGYLRLKIRLLERLTTP